MALEIICPFCAHPNGLGKIFCASCGQNMQQGDKPPKIMGKGYQSPGKKIVMSVIKTLILLLLGGGVGMLFWPVKPMARRAEGAIQEAHYKAFQKNAQAFGQNIESVKAGNLERAVFQASEEQANAYLKATLDANNDRIKVTGAMTPKVTDLCVDFRDKEALLFLQYKIGPINLTYELGIDPGNRENGFTTKISSARVGHLPLPMPELTSSLVTSKFNALLKGLGTADKLLQNTHAWQFKEDQAGAVFFKTKPSPESL